MHYIHVSISHVLFFRSHSALFKFWPAINDTQCLAMVSTFEQLLGVLPIANTLMHLIPSAMHPTCKGKHFLSMRAAPCLSESRGSCEYPSRTQASGFAETS